MDKTKSVDIFRIETITEIVENNIERMRRTKSLRMLSFFQGSCFARVDSLFWLKLISSEQNTKLTLLIDEVYSKRQGELNE